MCTILLQSETLPAEKRSRKASQAEVDKPMEYDSKLSEPFTREELQKIFGKDRMEPSSISKCLSPLLSAELYAVCTSQRLRRYLPTTFFDKKKAPHWRL